MIAPLLKEMRTKIFLVLLSLSVVVFGVLYGVQYIGIEPYKPEDISDLERKLNPQTIQGVMKIGRNEPCPCGSGKKFKKCCRKSVD